MLSSQLVYCNVHALLLHMPVLIVHNVAFYDPSAKATDEYELARKKVSYFINALEPREIVFTRNATEAINLVAYSWGLTNLEPGDEVRTSISLFQASRPFSF